MATLKLREALYYRLSNYAGLTALVSTRIYPIVAPQKAAMPYVLYEQISRWHAHAHGLDATTYNSMIHVTAWADDYDEADNISVQVRLALQDYSGNMAGAGDTFTVQRIFYDGRADLTDMDPETNQVSYQIVQTFIVWHE